MHISELLNIRDEAERDRLLRRAFAPYTEPVDVDGSEYETLIVLLNLTFKRDQNKNLCDVDLAGHTINDQKHLARCINTVRWQHTHNLKYPDCRVRGQRLVVEPPELIPGVVSSAGLPVQMGWANNGSEFNYAKLFCSSFRHQGLTTNLAEQLLVNKTSWHHALECLRLSPHAIVLLCQRLLENSEFPSVPSEVSIYSSQIRFLYQGEYVAITPVVSNTLMCNLQHLIRERRVPTTIIKHDYSSIFGSLVGATGGNIAVMHYPPLVFTSKTHDFIDSKMKRLRAGYSLFDNTILNNNILIDALHRLAYQREVNNRQRRHQRLAALRHLRRQLAYWIGDVIELKDVIEQEDEKFAVMPETLERQFINQPLNQLSELAPELTRQFHLSLQHHPVTRRYAFHPDLLEPVNSQLTWLLKKLAQDNNIMTDEHSGTHVYLHLSGLKVFDASALANPYLCGIPSLTALAGFCHDYERQLSALIQSPCHFTEVAWYISQFCPVSGRKLPEASIPAKIRTISAIRRPGFIENRYCDLGMDLVIKVHFSLAITFVKSDLLEAALPSRFAGGYLLPPSLSEGKQWYRLYTSLESLFTPLSHLPRNGCWIYPFNSDITSLDALFDILTSDQRLRPVSSGFIFLEALQYRPGSLEKRHTYAESTLGLSLCVNPLEMRLAGKNKFYNQAFWQLNDEKNAILITGPADMGQNDGTMHTS